MTCKGDGAAAKFVDGGRPGYRDRGIQYGGPADQRSAAAANALLNQPADTVCLETTLRGGRWLLDGDGELAMTGADMGWEIDGLRLPMNEAVTVSGSTTLEGGFAREGCRSYLALRGSWELPRLLGSVEEGLPGSSRIHRDFSWSVRCVTGPLSAHLPSLTLPLSEPVVIKAVPGPEWDLLDRERQKWLTMSTFRVGAESNRQGIRLESATVTGIDLPTLLSSPVLPGTVQLTPSGPILLGPDAQTIGGYPRVLIATERLCSAFQLRPGGRLRFRVDP